MDGTKRLPNFDNTTFFEAADVIEGESDDITEFANENDQRIHEILSGFDGDPEEVTFTIKVLRVIPNAGKYESCFAATPAELPIFERIRNEWGPGQYEIRIYKNNRIWKRPTFTIAAPLGLKPAIAAPVPNDMSGLAQMLAEQNRRQMTELRELLVQRQPDTNHMESMSTMMALLVQMKDFVAPSAAPAATDPIKMLKDALQIKEMILGDEGSGNSTMDSMLKLANNMLPTLAGLGGGASRKQLTTPQPMPVKVRQLKPRKSAPQPQPIPPEVKEMKLGLIALCQGAKRNADPEPYAFMILDQFDPEQIHHFIASDNALQNLAKIHKDVLNYPGWFEDLREIILNELAGDEPVESAGGVDNLTINNIESIQPHDHGKRNPIEDT
ncbi:MAG: hypothetical protein OEZ39_20250 [Gammaproteobacteria bacterium]|nr:hypothetical protein [Gammaproteobacteria bacterium]